MDSPEQPSNSLSEREGGELEQKSTRTVFVIIFAVLIIAITGASGYFLGRRTRELSYQSPLPSGLQTTEITEPIPTTVQPSMPASSTGSAQIAGIKIWRTYTDTEHGFEIKYPKDWSQLILSDKVRVALIPRLPPEPLGEIYTSPPGVEIYSSKLKNCTNSSDYANNEILPLKTYYQDISLKPLDIGNLDGFIAEGLPGTTEPTGSEAFIVHCPVVIRISLDPTGIENAKQIFQQMLSTINVWTPKK